MQISVEEQLGSDLYADLVTVAKSSGCEVLEAVFVGGRLQIVLEHPDGTTLTHCEEVSRKISDRLDVSDFSAAKYVLEVSSPGLDRKLYDGRDYERFAGHPARVTWRHPDTGKRTDVGRLEPRVGDVTTEPLRLKLAAGEILEIPISVISEARLEIEI